MNSTFAEQNVGDDSGREPSPADPSEGTVGEVLRRARENAGLSTADIAEVLRFGTRQIEALEADRYESLAGATLVRGMVRGYAKLLRLDAEALVARLEHRVPRPLSDVRPPANIGAAGDGVDAQPVSLRSISLALTLAAALLLLVYFAADLLRVSEELKPPAASAGPATPPATAERDILRPPTVSPNPVTQAPTLVAETAPVSAPPASAQPALAGAASAEIAAAETPDAAAQALGQGLVIDFDDRSWVEVRDASQSIVLSGEFGKGMQKTVNGKAPYQLWIGRASVVRVSYRGKPIDIKSRTREDVARLTVEARDS